MKRSDIYTLVFLTVFVFFNGMGPEGRLLAQQKKVQYDRDFVFRDGVYLTFEDFKNNYPIPVSKIVFNSNKGDKDFIKYALDKPSFIYLDGFGKEVSCQSDDVWGYCSNGVIFINHGTDFNRVTILGSICHFVAVIPTRIGVSDPFYYNQPFGNREQYTYVSEQMIIDFEFGKVMLFNVENMELMLMRDEALYKEFAALKKKQKRDSIFVYLRKYNEKHPIFFPE